MDPRYLSQLWARFAGRPGMLPMPPAPPAGPWAPGAAPQPGAVPQPPQPGAVPQPQQQQQQPAQLPGAVSTEQAAAERFDMLQRAGMMPGQQGMFDGLAPSGPGRSNNLFAASPNWYSGLFNTTKRLTPFDTFYVPEAQSQSWL